MQENIGVQIFEKLSHTGALHSEIILAEADRNRIKKIIVPFSL